MRKRRKVCRGGSWLVQKKEYGRGLCGNRHVRGLGERLMEEEDYLWTRKLDDMTCGESRLLEVVVYSWRRRLERWRRM